MADPTDCAYAPPGEYMKDHSIIGKDGWFHLFNISGTAGYYHGYNGNEETVAWSVSRDLVTWEFRGHVLHASQWDGFFDQHEVWAPFAFAGPDGYYLYYTGIVHPHRPLEYRKLGHDHPWVQEGHRETQGIARSTDLTDWVKISHPHHGSGVPGRDSHVVRDDDHDRWLLYSCIGTTRIHVSQSNNLENWEPLGICAEIPGLESGDSRLPPRAGELGRQLNVAESPTVMRHPRNGRWILLLNWQFILSDDPCRFDGGSAEVYDFTHEGEIVDCGFANETIALGDRWYRSGSIGQRDYWKLGFTEIAWDDHGAFRIVRPSALAMPQA